MNFSLDLLFEIFGYSGGFILGLCLLPQIYKSIKTKTTKDISFGWQFLYGCGLSLILSYAVYNKLHAVYIPGFVELLCIFLLIGLKLKYDIIEKTNNNLSNDL